MATREPLAVVAQGAEARGDAAAAGRDAAAADAKDLAGASTSICEAALQRACQGGPRSLPGELRELPKDYGTDGMCPYHRYLPADHSESFPPVQSAGTDAPAEFKHSSSLSFGDVQRQLPKPEKMKDIVRYKGPASQKTVQKQAATNAELQRAVENGDVNAVAGILRFGLAKRCVNVNAPLWPKRETMLHLAARRNSREICTMLLEAQAELHAEEITDGRQPLHDACAQGGYDVAELLLDKRARVDEATFAGLRATHWAAVGGHTDVVDLLLDRGAKIDAASSNTMEPLHHAASKGHADVARLLCRRGAKVDVETHGGQRPLHLACHGGHTEAAAVLLDFGALGGLEDFGEGGTLRKWRESPLEDLVRSVEGIRFLRDEAEELHDMGQEEDAQQSFQLAVDGYVSLGLETSAAIVVDDAAKCGVMLILPSPQ